MYGDAVVHDSLAYHFSSDLKTLSEAEAACAAKHPFGRLVEIMQRAEMSFLMAIAYQKDGNLNNYYVGQFNINYTCNSISRGYFEAALSNVNVNVNVTFST